MASFVRNFFQNSPEFIVYCGVNINVVEGSSYRYDADPGGLVGDAEGLDDEEFEIIDKPILSMQLLEDITASISWAFLEPCLKILGCSLKILSQLEAPENKELLTDLVTMAIRVTVTVDGHFSDGVCPLQRAINGLEQCLETVKKCVEEVWSWIFRAICTRELADGVAVLKRMLEDVLPTFQIVEFSPKVYSVYSAIHQNRLVFTKQFFEPRAKRYLQVLDFSLGFIRRIITFWNRQCYPSPWDLHFIPFSNVIQEGGSGTTTNLAAPSKIKWMPLSATSPNPTTRNSMPILRPADEDGGLKSDCVGDVLPTPPPNYMSSAAAGPVVAIRTLNGAHSFGVQDSTFNEVGGTQYNQYNGDPWKGYAAVCIANAGSMALMRYSEPSRVQDRGMSISPYGVMYMYQSASPEALASVILALTAVIRALQLAQMIVKMIRG